MARGRLAAGLARWAESLWYGRSPLALLLQPAAWCFGIVVRLRRGEVVEVEECEAVHPSEIGP